MFHQLAWEGCSSSLISLALLFSMVVVTHSGLDSYKRGEKYEKYPLWLLYAPRKLGEAWGEIKKEKRSA